MRRPGVAAALVAGLVATSGAASAQPAAGPSLWPGRVVVAIGGAWLGTDALGDVRAATRLTTLGTTSPPPATLFDTSSSLGGAPAVEGTITMAITPGWAIEVRGAMGHPTLTTTITNDVEASGTFTATERVAEYVVDASVLYHPGWGALGSRTRAFLLAGAGYLRQLHDDDVLVETGTSAHAGAGARVWLAGGQTPGFSAGLTGDVRWVFRRDGIAFEDQVRSLPAFSLRAFAGF